MQQLGLVVGRPTFCNFTPRVHQKQSQKIKNHKIFLGDMPQDPPSRRATRALIAYWNPPFEKSRSATVQSFLRFPWFLWFPWFLRFPWFLGFLWFPWFLSFLWYRNYRNHGNQRNHWNQRSAFYALYVP